MAEITSSAVREVGRVVGVKGFAVIIVDCDAVRIWGPAGVVLDAAGRDLFTRYWCEAERAAEAWAKEHAGAGDG